MIKEHDLFGVETDKIQIAIERLKTFEPPEGYYLAFSGGKDSVVIKALADIAGVKYDAHYNMTTIDPPELVQFIKSEHPDVELVLPEEPFLRQLETRGFPLRHRRWCCEEYKERGGLGRIVVTGIRWAESTNRASRKMVESCYKDTTKRYINPVIDWSDGEVWEFIKSYNIPYCELYDQGFKRIGCLFCPFASTKQRKYEVFRYPKIASAFIRAFRQLYKNRRKVNNPSVDRWKDGDAMFTWWLGAGKSKQHPDQLALFE